MQSLPQSALESYFFLKSRSVVSDSLWPHGLYSPWTSPGQVTGVLLGSLDSGHSWCSVLYWLLHSCWVWAPRCGQRVSRCKMYKEQVTKRHMWTLDISTCIEWKWTIQRQTMTEWEKPWTKYPPPAAAQSGWTLCDPMGYSPPGSSVHGIPQARILEWVAIFFSRVSSQLRDQTHVWVWDARIASLALAGRFFTTAPLGKPYMLPMRDKF